MSYPAYPASVANQLISASMAKAWRGVAALAASSRKRRRVAASGVASSMAVCGENSIMYQCGNAESYSIMWR